MYHQIPRISEYYNRYMEVWCVGKPISFYFR